MKLNDFFEKKILLNKNYREDLFSCFIHKMPDQFWHFYFL